MSFTAVTINGYRSVRAISFPIEPLSVLAGANGVGKTNLYRSLFLLHSAARGTITREIAEEGGVRSVMWAGTRKKREPVRLSLTARLSDLTYRIDIGLPSITQAALSLEPRIKEEELSVRIKGRTHVVMSRRGHSAWLIDTDGKREIYDRTLLASETGLVAFRDSARYPHLESVRQELLDWRFYHDFRVDSGSPLRSPCLAISTPTMASDGSDLAAALATVFDISGDADDIENAIQDAFPGSRLSTLTENGHSSLTMTFTDMPRPFEAHELSDGTLRYLCLIGALCGYRLPSFVALNEPEASLHPDMLLPLARLIARAAEHTRIWVVTHSQPLAREIARLSKVAPRTVVKDGGATWIDGLTASGDFKTARK